MLGAQEKWGMNGRPPKLKIVLQIDIQTQIELSFKHHTNVQNGCEDIEMMILPLFQKTLSLFEPS